MIKDRHKEQQFCTKPNTQTKQLTKETSKNDKKQTNKTNRQTHNKQTKTNTHSTNKQNKQTNKTNKHIQTNRQAHPDPVGQNKGKIQIYGIAFESRFRLFDCLFVCLFDRFVVVFVVCAFASLLLSLCVRLISKSGFPG